MHFLAFGGAFSHKITHFSRMNTPNMPKALLSRAFALYQRLSINMVEANRQKNNPLEKDQRPQKPYIQQFYELMTRHATRTEAGIPRFCQEEQVKGPVPAGVPQPEGRARRRLLRTRCIKGREEFILPACGTSVGE